MFKSAPKGVRDKVHTLRTVRDLEIAYRKVKEAKHVVILGGGILGTELAWHLGRMSTSHHIDRYRIDKNNVDRYHIDRYYINRYYMYRYYMYRYHIDRYHIYRYQIDRYQIDRYHIDRYHIDIYYIDRYHMNTITYHMECNPCLCKAHSILRLSSRDC